MDGLRRSLNLEQAFRTEPNFDKYARQILENSKTISTTTTTTTSNPPTRITDFLQEFGATFINSIQLQNFQKSLHTNRSAGANASSSATSQAFAAAFSSSSIVGANAIHNALKNFNTTTESTNDMEIEFIPNHIIIDSSSFETMDNIQKQLQYDKFMNEVWIGIVLTLILISMIFCVCSCFLYHQFRTWKRNYHSTVVQVNAADVESRKWEADYEDPVPEYTLVSGLPSYEAALELMQKSPAKSCLIVYPSVFNVFNKNERPMAAGNGTQQQQQQNSIEITTPLLGNSSNNATTTCSKACSDTDDNRVITLPNELMESSMQTVIKEKELLEMLNEQSTTTTTTDAVISSSSSETKSALEELKK